MQTTVILMCDASILLASIVGVWRYKSLEYSLKILVLLLVVTSLSELCCFAAAWYKNYYLKLSIFHFFNVIQASLITAYFVYAIGLKKPVAVIGTATFLWTLAGVGNAVFLQPLGTLNSYMLMLESMVVITFSLFFIYSTLKYDWAESIYEFVHFRIAVLLLVFWGFTFFFWGFVAILWKNKWQHVTALMYAHSAVEITLYVGIAVSLYQTNRKTIANEAR